MDWTTIIHSSLPLIGVVIGGLFTWLVSAHAESKRATAALRADGRRSELARNEQHRESLQAMHERVVQDFAELRQYVQRTTGEVNDRAADMLDSILDTVVSKHDRAGVLIGLVDDESVRGKADEIYVMWGRFAANEAARLSRDAPPFEGVEIEELLKAHTRLSEAVRGALSRLNDQQAALFHASCGKKGAVVQRQ